MMFAMEKHVLIIGAGPAGSSAAMTLRMRNVPVTVLSAGTGALDKARRVDNYPGLPEMSGPEMNAIFRRQAEGMGAQYKTALARYVQRTRKGFTVLAGEEMLKCDAVILCSGIGRVSRIEGEDALIGRGVSYCATCDGMLYRGGRVAVVAQDASFEEDVRFLMSICQVDYYKEKKHDAAEGVTVREGKPTQLREENDKIVLATELGEDVYDCVFILRPAVALTTLLPALELQGDSVRVDENMATNIPGVYAAGDITGAPYQAARAVGQGNTAALAVAKYLSEKE